MDQKLMYSQAESYVPVEHTPEEPVGPTKYVYDMRSAFRDGYRAGFAQAFTPSFYIGAATGVVATVVVIVGMAWLS